MQVKVSIGAIGSCGGADRGEIVSLFDFLIESLADYILASAHALHLFAVVGDDSLDSACLLAFLRRLLACYHIAVFESDRCLKDTFTSPFRIVLT